MCGQPIRLGIALLTVCFALFRINAQPQVLTDLAGTGMSRFTPGPSHRAEELFRSLRQGDTAGLDAALKAGADPNTRDDSGATALMRAVIYAPAACVTRLLDVGAEVNAADPLGATALMWAGAQTAKIRLLLDRGAHPNLRMKDGATALIAAARFGNREGMQVLVARGADPSASRGGALDLLRIAYGQNDPAMVRTLAAAGVRLIDPHTLPTDLLVPASGDATTMRALLAAGANPREELRLVSLTAPVLSIAAFKRANDVVTLLLDRGADPNARASHGQTPLMFAAASDSPGTDAVRRLLERGAEVSVRDERGRTALDWALAHGDEHVAGVLRAAGATATPPAPAPMPIASPRTAARAIETALERLQPAGPAFHEHAGCISCHHQSLPAVAVTRAAERGLAVDKELARHPAEATLAGWRRQENGLLAGRINNVQAFIATSTYGLFALGEEGVPSTSTTDAVVLRLAALQSRDGRWDGGSHDLRPPLDGSAITRTALAVRGLSVYAPRGREDMNGHISRGLSFLRSAVPADTQDEAFKLLGLVWGRAGAERVAKGRVRVLALQRSDGGWGQLPQMPPDAFATGQALYAIGAAGISPNAAAYRKGVQYLLRTQLEDGTWFVRSRAIGFQRYFESGFPHGRDQFISAAATSWAAMALAYAVDH